jgi:tRNA (guanine-N7-)-methyltransferase
MVRPQVMHRRIRHHVNPFSYRHLATGAGALVLDPERPVEVELGCAEADFLFARAVADPERTYIGVDIRADLVTYVNEKAERLGITCLRAVYANLLIDLPQLFDPGTIDLCHINFPDPFFKRTQHKRRFLTPELVEALGSIIRPGGVLSFQSDVFELGLEALDLLERSAPRFCNQNGPWSFARSNPHGGATTRRERRCLRRGWRVWRLAFRRVQTSEPRVE